MVSALKVGGKRLHELARAGVEVERAPRPVTVTRFVVEPAGQVPTGPVLAIDVECSSGTYIRSLAADLGTLLGGGAHLRNLRRVEVGTFTVDQAVRLDELEASAEPAKAVMPPPDALGAMPRALVQAEVAATVAHGKVLPLALLMGCGATGPGPWAVLDEHGALLAVYQANGHAQAKPVVVLAVQRDPAAG
jgi:tRNA pseudouridine55 synthase